ncbi:MAG TPA: Rid family detoxifying hydrolase [Candidatus Cloacimonadota bacterium]|jgi:2-iminobutanoate/2-iminopropanoate deaminase|nr:Rid family detoxifying hydrolase [Candidatus Cloacimonadota bacterium]HOD53062.1 Rid family detoxifying hydrolase [Candidatus Cloacimonadota bacterium]HPM00717.1 Rid family detoxifying hydrolase [Candidatus Cloacimonadota bacterium]
MKSITTNLAPQAIGPYSQATLKKGILYISGQLGIDPVTGNLARTFEEQTVLVFQNIQAILSAANLTFHHVVKVSVFLTDMKDFVAMNEIYKRYFNEPFPAREAIQVAALPKGGEIEISVIAMES